MALEAVIAVAAVGLEGREYQLWLREVQEKQMLTRMAGKGDH